MAAVNTTSRDLGLRAPSVVVVDALLSCLPCKNTKTGADAPITPLTLLTVYAANDTLCFRAKGITERQLRRHLVRLEEVGLIQRQDSANGKRFPIHRGGKVVGAFGIDLSPLLARSEELCKLAQKRRDETYELRGLQSYIQKLRVQCLRLPLDEDLSAFLEGTRNIMRRASTTLNQARAIISKLTDILMGVEGTTIEETPTSFVSVKTEQTGTHQPQPKTAETAKVTASDGQNARHKEPPKSYTKKTTPGSIAELWQSLPTLSEFYPGIPRSEEGLVQIIFEFGKMLRIGTNALSRALSMMGYAKILVAQDKIAAKAGEISNPEAYFARIIADTNLTKVGHGQLSRLA